MSATAIGYQPERDIQNLPDSGWYPIQEAEQSRYTWSPCEACGGRIEAGERHYRRYWKGGLAEVKQHIECPVQ